MFQNTTVSLEINKLEQLMQLAHLLVHSGLYPDIDNVEKAAAIILAGSELGLKPCAALSNLNIIKNKVTMSANLMAQMLKSHPKYDYRIKEHSEKICVIEVLEKTEQQWTVLGEASFSWQEANDAGLTTNPKLQNWQKFAKDMLFARTISRAVRQLAPDVVQGLGIYETQEMIEVVNQERKANRSSAAAPVSATVAENNGITDWIQPQFTSPEQGLEWAQKVLNCSVEAATAILDNTEADASGKKSIAFIGVIRSIWDNGGAIPDAFIAPPEEVKEPALEEVAIA